MRSFAQCRDSELRLHDAHNHENFARAPHTGHGIVREERHPLFRRLDTRTSRHTTLVTPPMLQQK